MFSVTAGTMFDSSNVSLDKWFYAIDKFLSNKKGVSSGLQLSRDIGVAQKPYGLCSIGYGTTSMKLKPIYTINSRVPYKSMKPISAVAIKADSHSTEDVVQNKRLPHSDY